MRVLAPAKINLHLRVGHPRAGDALHPLLFWACSIGLFDTLEFERARGRSVASSAPFDLRLAADPGDRASSMLPPDRSGNLVWRAVLALAEFVTRREIISASPASLVGGITAVLHKRIGIGAGLGGGSSDAARTLLALNKLLELGLTLDDLSTIAATLGSDVPLFLHLPSAIVRGRGEIVPPAPAPAKARW